MDKLFWSSALGALATALATPAVAQEQPALAAANANAPQAAPGEAKAAPDDQTNDADIVVTARRRSERLIDVPVAATVITPAQIRQYDLTSVANIKILAPQVSLDRGFTGSGTSITMRGVSSASLDAGVEQSVLLDFDGMARCWQPRRCTLPCANAARRSE